MTCGQITVKIKQLYDSGMDKNLAIKVAPFILISEDIKKLRHELIMELPMDDTFTNKQVSLLQETSDLLLECSKRLERFYK